MTDAKECPTGKTLALFLYSWTTQEERRERLAALNAHTRDCPTCQARQAEIIAAAAGARHPEVTE